MTSGVKLREIHCKSAIGKCGFPGGGFSVNPYLGCGHGCVYCYARFMKRFTGHQEKWGSFVDIKVNIAQVCEKQLQTKRYNKQLIYIGTVTDPYQQVEEKFKLTRRLLSILHNFQNPVCILTKSDLILRDLDLLKQIKDPDVSFTITTLNKKWKSLTEPNSSSVEKRLKAARTLSENSIKVSVMMGPYWPIFTDPEALFKKFKRVGISHVFTESFNTVGGNWTGVEMVLKKHYPEILPKFKEIFFKRGKFYEFYSQEQVKLKKLSKQFKLPITIYFGLGHAAKFK